MLVLLVLLVLLLLSKVELLRARTTVISRMRFSFLLA
jgi:hypothetical protein